MVTGGERIKLRDCVTYALEGENFVAANEDPEDPKRREVMERAGLTAVFIRSFGGPFEQLQADYPLGLVHAETNEPVLPHEIESFPALSERVTETFGVALAAHALSLEERIARGEENVDLIAYRRLVHLVHDVPRFVMRGVYTADRIMIGLLELVPELVGGNSYQQWQQVAHNSFSLMWRWASMNALTMVPFVERCLMVNYRHFRPEYFFLGQGGGLELLPKMVVRAGDFEPGKFTVGCPAMYMEPPEASFIHKVWNWYIDVLAPVVYGKMIEEKM